MSLDFIYDKNTYFIYIISFYLGNNT